MTTNEVTAGMADRLAELIVAPAAGAFAELENTGSSVEQMHAGLLATISAVDFEHDPKMAAAWRLSLGSTRGSPTKLSPSPSCWTSPPPARCHRVLRWHDRRHGRARHQGRGDGLGTCRKPRTRRYHAARTPVPLITSRGGWAITRC
ncbi:hypothetical protein [Kutzneria sp. NPDC051319]|uniref:hypothetical protein n=1 Tax=Kutzneria sp. NPDC051319 TaxID=3155047 RepID=UPI0034205E73